MLINSVNFDTGDLRDCACSVNAQVVRMLESFGKNALRLLRQDSVAYAEIRAAAGGGRNYYDARTAFYRFYFLYGEKATPAAGRTPICAFHDRTNQAKACLHLDRDGRLVFCDKDGTVLRSGTTVLSAGRVYMLRAKIGTGEHADWEVRINSNVEFSGKSNLGTANNGSIHLGGSGAYTDQLYFDEIAMDDAAYPPAVSTIRLP